MQVFAPDQGYPAGTVSLEFLSNPELVKVEKDEQEEDPEKPAVEGEEAAAEEGSIWEDQPMSNEELTEFALNPTNLGSFGLKIMVENQQELEFDHELVKNVFAGIISVARHQVNERPMSPAEHSSVQELEEVDGS